MLQKLNSRRTSQLAEPRLNLKSECIDEITNKIYGIQFATALATSVRTDQQR